MKKIINPFENKFVVNFHHADFDGAISGSCCRAAFGENAVYKALGIPKVTSEVDLIKDDAEIILLTDISIETDALERFLPYINKDKLVIWDHHINEHSKEIFSNMPNNTISILDEDICGATITWLELMKYYPNNQKLQDLEEIVYFSDVYDMWRIDNKDFEYAVTLNDLLDYQIGYTPDQFRDRWFNKPNPFKLTKKEQKIIDTKKIRGNRNLIELEDNAILFEYKNIVVVMTESKSPTDYIKMLFMNSVLESEQVDMFIFKYPGTTQSSVRIPNGSSITDLNDWYEDFGCKGHKKAGGIPAKEYPKLQKVLETI